MQNKAVAIATLEIAKEGMLYRLKVASSPVGLVCLGSDVLGGGGRTRLPKGDTAAYRVRRPRGTRLPRAPRPRVGHRYSLASQRD